MRLSRGRVGGPGGFQIFGRAPDRRAADSFAHSGEH